MRPLDVPMPQVRDEAIILTGGINQAETQLTLKSGELIDCSNYMEVDGPSNGYVSLKGYERYDGTTLASTVNTIALNDDGINSETVLLLESDGLSNYTDTIGSYVFTAYSITEPTDSGFFQWVDTSFLQGNKVGGLVWDDTLNATDLSGDEFCIDLRYRSHASVDTTVDGYIFRKPGVVDIWWDTDATDSFLAFSITETDSNVETVTTNIQLIADTEYHIALNCKVDSGHYYIRMMVNGEPVYDKTTLQVAEVDSTLGLISTVGEVRLLSSDPSADTKSGYGYLDMVRIDVGRYNYFGSYTVPELMYSDPGYNQINYDDRDRELERLTINRIPGVSTGPNGLHYYTKDSKLYVLNDNNVSGATLYRADATGWFIIDGSFNASGNLKAVEWRIDGYQESSLIMAIVDGVSMPRIWNGTSMTVLGTGNSSTLKTIYDTYGIYPTEVIVWANRLVFGYENGHFVFSANFDPLDFDNGFGGEVIGGDKLTGLSIGPEETMVVFMRNSIKVCYSGSDGTVDLGFKIKSFSRTSGCLANTVQRSLSDIVYADDRGLLSFQTTDQFGDFTSVALSKKINKTYQQKKTQIVSSMIDKGLNQYRLFFSDGSGMIFTFNQDGVMGTTFCDYPIQVKHVVSAEDANGDIVKFFTSTTGWVYKMDSGTSFDGAPIDRFLKTSFHSYKSPRYWKRFRKLIMEIDADDYELDFNVNFAYDYGGGFLTSTSGNSISTIDSNSIWGLGKWGTFKWRPGDVARRPYYTFSGYGTNMSIELKNTSKYINQHTIHNAIVDYTVNNRKRR